MTKFEQTTLESNRLKLRWLKESDIDNIFHIFSDEETMKYWNAPPMQNQSEAEELFSKAEKNYESGDSLRFALESKETDQFLGSCSLFNFSHPSRRAEIGYILGREYWGKGLMGEALQILIHYAFNVLKLHRLEAEIDSTNEASKKSLLRLGFSEEGLLRERWILDGQTTDSGLYGLLSKEWPP